MNLKKLLSLVLAAVMLLGCMGITAFAGGGDIVSITLDRTSVDLAAGQTVKLNATVIEATLGDVSEWETVIWTSSNEDVATVSNGTVTAVKNGTATITAYPYGFDNLTDTCTVTVCDGTGYLDDTTSSTAIIQNYAMTQKYETFTDTTRVKLAWEISDINVSYTSHKTWDPIELKWVEVKEDVTVEEHTATFKITNYSSKAKKATVDFAVEEALSDTYSSAISTFENNDCTVSTPVNDSQLTYTDADFTELAQTITVSLKFDTEAFAKLSATDEATKYGTYTVTISDDPGCFTAGTKITMPDGSQKNIEDIEDGEEVLTFNHETGKYEAQQVYLAYAGEHKARAFTLHFDNGNTLSIVAEHDLFEKESLNYVIITKANAEQFVGHHFYSVADGKFVQLTGVTYETKSVDYYSLYVLYNANCIANGMLSLPDDVGVFLQIFRFNDGMTIDQAQLEADIALYGIYEYRTDAIYSKEDYDAFNFRYANIVVGKGLTTWDKLIKAGREFFTEE